MEKNKLYEIFYLTGVYLTAITITNLEILNLDYELQQIMILLVIIGEYIYGSFDIRIQQTNTVLTFIAILMLYFTTKSTRNSKLYNNVYNTIISICNIYNKR